ncbi:MAG TPA: hypothetical protein VF070_17725 [Streptosporangiaceae bacterium]
MLAWPAGFEDGGGEVALPAWPLTGSGYAACGNLLGTGTQPVPPGPVARDAVIRAGGLALRHLS